MPRRYAKVADSAYVHLSLSTDSLDLARAKEGLLWAELVQMWEARLDGESGEAARRYEAARNIAKTKRLRYRPAETVAGMPVDQILDRIEAISERRGEPVVAEGAALLGAVRPPPMTISAALEAYWSIARDKVLDKSPDQVRRWRNPIKKAIGNLIEVLGDMEIAQITADDMLDFRDWWLDRIEAEHLTPNSANKDFTYVAVVLKRVAEAKRLGFVPPVTGLRIAEGRTNTRLPFSDDFIRNKLLHGLGGLRVRTHSQ